jgi:hypothetical protein
LIVEWAAVELCADYALAGDWTNAHAQAQRALPVRARNPTVTPFAGQLRWYETEALIRGGDQEMARKDLALFDAQIGNRRRYRLAYLRSMAVLDSAMSKDPQPYLRQALQLAEEMDLPGEAWPLCAALGETEHAKGIQERLLYPAPDDIQGLQRG